MLERQTEEENSVRVSRREITRSDLNGVSLFGPNRHNFSAGKSFRDSIFCYKKYTYNLGHLNTDISMVVRRRKRAAETALDLVLLERDR